MSENNIRGTVSAKEPSLVAQINISVRGLVEFIYRSGDIDNRHKASSGPEVMLEGANIHRMIQKRMGTNYHAEYYLKEVIRRSEYEIIIDGRADGIIIPDEWGPYIEAVDELPEPEENGLHNTKNELCDISKESHIMIDEIKTTYRELERIKEPDKVHMAQACVYAYIFAKQYDLPAIAVRITYCNTQTYETRYFDTVFTRDKINEWFSLLINEYLKWADFQVNWKRIRNASIQGMSFPFAYREGQKELVAQVFNSIEKKERLFLMAPTGVGKTISNVYPSLKALSLSRAQKIFYLTAKTITRQVASECIDLLRQQDLRLKSVVLTAKEKICITGQADCNPVSCPYAKGHFDRINDAMFDLLSNEDDFSRDKIMEYADKHKVCPFEFALDMSLFSDMIICDYNYVFDPHVYLRRYFSEGNSGEYLFLVDEAHNLVERGMKMYSATLTKERFLDVKRLVRDTDAKLARALEAVNKNMLLLKRDCEDVKLVEDFEELVAHLLRLTPKIEQFMDDNEHFEEMDQVMDLYFAVHHFLYIYENMRPEDYVSFLKFSDNNEFEANLMCANPAGFLQACTDRARFTVFFSATLLPIEYYRKMLGAKESDPAVYAHSIFDPGKRKLLIARDVTSKYTRRSDGEYGRMAEYIYEITRVKSGNYMVFFPSFAMLSRVYEIYMSRFYDESTQEVVVQESSMKEEEREEFILAFTEDNPDITLIGFCVLGGIFSEGIDLKNDALIGAMIIGTGLPMVCPERELLKRRYDMNGFNGFDYAYRFPGMNKALQAAGRVIRTTEDMGVVALLDERYLGRDYVNLFPREWADFSTCRVDDVGEYLDEFWKEG